jgi:hypothetical protein
MEQRVLALVAGMAAALVREKVQAQADLAAEREVGLARAVRVRDKVQAVAETGVALAAEVRALDPDAEAMESRHAEEKERAKADMAAVLDMTQASHRE